MHPILRDQWIPLHPEDFGPEKLFEKTCLKVKDWLSKGGFAVVDEDLSRPWGGYVRVSDTKIGGFLHSFFPGVEVEDFGADAGLSPKILIVKPGMRLSWQYHKLRGEMWRVLAGPVGVFLGKSDRHPKRRRLYKLGESVTIPCGFRHRLIGLDSLGVVAEIWVHTDRNNLSSEDDIVRVADDFGR